RGGDHRLGAVRGGPLLPGADPVLRRAQPGAARPPAELVRPRLGTSRLDASGLARSRLARSRAGPAGAAPGAVILTGDRPRGARLRGTVTGPGEAGPRGQRRAARGWGGRVRGTASGRPPAGRP